MGVDINRSRQHKILQQFSEVVTGTWVDLVQYEDGWFWAFQSDAILMGGPFPTIFDARKDAEHA